MKFKEYQQLTKRTLPNLDATYSNDVVLLPFLQDVKLPVDMLNILHTRLGIVSELEELITALRAKDTVNIGEELGDMLWYIANDLNISLRKGFIEQAPYDALARIEFMGVPMVTDGGYSLEGVEAWFPALVFNACTLADFAKKDLAYQKAYTPAHYLTTVGYLLGAINNIAITNGVDLEVYMEKNINKLIKRYPEKFTEEAAINRDTDAERKILES